MVFTLMNSKPAISKSTPWQGKKCAVVLTYDDALNVHLDKAIPLLDSLNLKATFYVSANFTGFKNRVNDWRKVSEKGHELGNHTLFHPCNGQLPGREWVNPDYDLSTYSVQRMVDEIILTNTLLQAVDGKSKRTFAYTCGEMKIGDTYFMDSLKNDVSAARAVRAQMHSIDQIDLYDIDSYMINGENGPALIELVNKALETESLLVFLFHGVGGEHNLNVSLEAHSQLLHYLKQNERQIWIAPMIDVAAYIRSSPRSG